MIFNGKNICSLFILLAAFLAVTPVCPALAGSMTNADTASFKWKFATLAPKGTSWAKQVEKILFPAVMEASDGKVYIKVYWGGIMGDDEDVLKKVRAGQLQGCGVAGQGAIMACPEFSVVCLPFMFNDYGEVSYIKGKLGPSINSYMKKNGFKLFTWNDQDMDQAYSMRLKLNTPGQFRQARFLSWFGILEEKTFQALGARYVKADVPDGASFLRQDKADSALGPAAFIVGTQMYAVIKYVNPIPIRYAPAPILISVKAYDEAPKNYVNRLWARRSELQKSFEKGLRKDNEKALQAMIQYGVKKVETTPKNLAEMKRLTRPVWDELAGKLYPKSLLDELLAYLEEYRKK